MQMINLINKKKQGLMLSKKELTFLVNGIAKEVIPDYQIAAWTMAVYFQGMTEEELYNFTMAMVHSGEIINLERVKGFKVDKHSTGGIGDKTSLLFAPIAACFDLKVTKLSGRGLGITGGTIDKLEAIPGFKVALSDEDFFKTTDKCGISIASQSESLVPADKKLYALRDVTGTVNSLPLIAASIMSKKLAIGADLILLDVKCGSGAFVETLLEARTLANLMINIGKKANKKVVVIISDMSKPLGLAIGNSLELKEVIASLKNQGPKDLQILVTHLVALALVVNKKTTDLETGIALVTKEMMTNRPLAKFYQFITAQGGDITYLDNIKNIKAKYILNIVAATDGYINIVDNYLLGELSVKLGAGRLLKNDKIDYDAGVLLHYQHGTFIKKGTVIMELHTNKPEIMHIEFITLAQKTFVISSHKSKQIPLILEILM